VQKKEGSGHYANKRKGRAKKGNLPRKEGGFTGGGTIPKGKKAVLLPIKGTLKGEKKKKKEG